MEVQGGDSIDGDDKTPVHFESGKRVTFTFISNICQGNHYLGLLTTLSEVSPLGPGLGLLLCNVWQDLITGGTVFRYPRFPH